MLAEPLLDRDTPEDAIAELVDAIKKSPERRDLLVQLLPERTSLYEGRSTNETIRIRGYILAAFSDAGLPDAALPYVLEELESGRDAYLVAGAAKALRGLNSQTSQVVPFLLKAVENIKYVDDALTFEQYRPRWPLASYTTALAEIFQTLGWLGQCAEEALPDLEALHEARNDEFSLRITAEIGKAIDRIRSARERSERDAQSCPCGVPVEACCCGDVSPDTDMGVSNGTALLEEYSGGAGVSGIAKVEMQDQDGEALTYGDYFSVKPSIVVFFYTRCNNPNKCSLTITKLGRLQKVIREEGLYRELKTAAISYDPEYDLPPRLRAYGENRGVTFSESDRILRTRTRAGFDALQEAFQLGVNFTGTLVNRHRIELFILDSAGNIAATFSRLQWDVGKVLEQAKVLLAVE